LPIKSTYITRKESKRCNYISLNKNAAFLLQALDV
jgi:hypothetical protein